MKHKHIAILSIIAISFAQLCASTSEKKIRTHFSTPKSKKTTIVSGRKIEANPRDSLLSDSIFSKIKFAGYDKSSSAAFESFFVTNNSKKHLVGIDIVINYYQTDGRKLHQRKEPIPINLPCGETRKIDLHSWDKQNSFHYYLSPQGRKLSSPYKVDITLNAVYVGDDASD